MDIQTLQSFFMWCTIVNVSLLLFWSLMFLAAPNLIYRIQKRWFPLSEESFTLVMYCFLGLFKIFVIVFNVVPYVALLIVGA